MPLLLNWPVHAAAFVLAGGGNPSYLVQTGNLGSVTSGGVGQYLVTLGEPLDVAQGIALATLSGLKGQIQATITGDTEVTVETFDGAGNAAHRNFQLVLFRLKFQS